MRMLVAVHKAADVPADSFYLPVHVGHALNPVSLGYQPDDEGQNISDLNASYCELTALYWALHNLRTDAVGLSHYRRYFTGEQVGPSGRSILSALEASALLERHDVVLAKPRNYVLETIGSHYRHAHHGGDLVIVRRTLEQLSPWAVVGWDRVMTGRKLSLYNMFLMRGDEFQRYGDWLFSVLERVAKEIDNEGRTLYQRRTYGYLAERLLNAYVRASPLQTGAGYRRVVNTEGEPRMRKGIAMIGRKLRHGVAK